MNRRKALAALVGLGLIPVAARLGIKSESEPVITGGRVVGWLDAGPAPWEGYHGETVLRLRYSPGTIVERVECYTL